MFSLLKRLLNPEPYPTTRPCDCGQEANGVCTVRIRIVGDGVAQQCPECLVQCGKVKEQIKAMSELII